MRFQLRCLLLIVLIVPLLPFAVQPVRACQCDDGPSFYASDAVFFGEVIETEDWCDGYWCGNRRLTIRVLQSWKGVTGREVSMDEVEFCGYFGEVGRTILVYASIPADDTVLQSSSCAMWYDEESVAEHLAEFDRVGLRPIELDDGPDPVFHTFGRPGAEVRPSGGLCGVGTGIGALLFLAILPFRSFRARQSRGTMG